MKLMLTALLGAAAVFAAGTAQAADTIKIGIVNAYSGQFADPAAQLDNGIKLYMQIHGDTVNGKKIVIIRKDVGGIKPPLAKQLAAELVTRDGVDILAGNLLTPNALAVAAVSADAEKFMVIMNASTSFTPLLATHVPNALLSWADVTDVRAT